ncbi:helix-turn-helix domain-containing protein [Nonomuraea guangzhouensis]|uniref:Helix-turn-helix domain-containing protein n=1 Tax=Nonomuraea guangzhouensis TaxID=1291555 RepID=A0ABW4G7H1_9ACTN|nr:helix-turn-helix transcriptional regulator [Nonomuraea guangzhouensis]
MARGKHIPTVASTRLAAELRSHREKSGLSQEAVAEQMGWAESKLYRIENDKSRVLVRDVKRLVSLYEPEEAQAHAIVELARVAGEPDWWHQYSGAIPEWFQVYVALETSASHVFGYDSELVPGIMQTESYARTIMMTAPDRGPDEEIENQVKVRINRQARLTGTNPLNLWIVLNEGVVRRKVGGPDVMREQIEHLIEIAQLRNVTLQVLPYEVGEHSAMHGSFTILQFPPAHDPDKVYLEQQIGGIYTQKTNEVERYKLLYDDVRARALGPGETIGMFRSIVAELT